MVIENLQIAPLAEWLLGSGWTQGLLWQPWGIALLVVFLAGGGSVLVLSLRRRFVSIGPAASLVWGNVLGALSLAVLAAVALCSTEITRNWLGTCVGSPVYGAMRPLLGEEWSGGAMYIWLAVTAGLLGIVYAVAWLVSVLLTGPVKGTRLCGRAVVEPGLRRVAHVAPPRLGPHMAGGPRRPSPPRGRGLPGVRGLHPLCRVVHGQGQPAPGPACIQNVLNLTIFLSMVFAWVLSALSLPADIRNRTLQTVVTKPVRKLEIVLGRALGFTLVGTVLLLANGLISYGFTVRSLGHTHQLTAAMLTAKSLPGNRGKLLQGTTTLSHGHEHAVTIIERPGELPAATVESQRDHTHDLYVSGSGDTAVYTLGPPQGQLQARVPIYGKLAFRDDTGAPKERGINVGDEWTYRSFIQGRTSAAAIWTFSGLSAEEFPESRFPTGIPVEMTIEVFRTHKGNQEKGVAGTISLCNPKTGKKVFLRNFNAQKFATDLQMLPRSFVTAGADGKAETIDLFRDLVSDDGQLQVILQCLEAKQYFGMAQPDLYIRAADNSFAWNFFKGYLGVWLQMVLVICLGVMFSTFLSGPVALLATMFVIVLGLFSGYVMELASGKMVGGGPFESVQRIMTQDNMISDLEPGIKTNVIKTLDQTTAVMMRYLSAVVPNVSENDYVDHVAHGFNVGQDLLLRCILCEGAYLLPVLLLGYLALKQREVAQ